MSHCAAHVQGFEQQLEELQRQGVKVLVTSRCQLSCGLQGAVQLDLRSLLPEHAADLLRRLAGAGRVTPPQLQRLAGLCAQNALALTIIGGFINSQVVTAEARHKT